MKKLCIVSPCYNEEEVIRQSAERLTKVINDLIEKQKIAKDSFVLYVNDGSKDNTWEIIKEINSTNNIINGLCLNKNVGSQKASLAGMMTAKEMCDMVITIDADLQDDLNAIEKMVDKHYEGNEIVYGVKVERTADPFLKRFTAESFYKLQKTMGIETIYNHSEFRLLSKKALDLLELFKERNIYIRGILPMLGLKSATVEDIISKREAGESKYNFSKLLSIAIDGITSFSIKPIRLITYIGVLMLIMSFIIFIYVITSYVKHYAISGWTSIMLSIWFIGSLILIAIGIVGEYIGKIYMEVKQRPMYSIKEILISTDKRATQQQEVGSPQ